MQDLDGFVRSGVLLFQDSVAWDDGTMPLNVSYYLGTETAPVELVSSVRAIVFRGDEVLVVSQKNGGVYILPGGRVEEGERPLDTLKREVIEETGWTLKLPRLLGWLHIHHLGPMPPGYRYPYPDFIWPIYIAEAHRYVPTAIVPDDYVSESSFHNINEVRTMPINRGELLLLEAAIESRSRTERANALPRRAELEGRVS